MQKKRFNFFQFFFHFSRTKRAATARPERIWDYAVIPYEIEANFSGNHKALFKQVGKKIYFFVNKQLKCDTISTFSILHLMSRKFKNQFFTQVMLGNICSFSWNIFKFVAYTFYFNQKYFYFQKQWPKFKWVLWMQWPKSKPFFFQKI